MRIQRVFRKPVPKRVLVFLAWFSHKAIRGIARYARQAGWTLDISLTYMDRVSYDVPADGMITLYHPAAAIAGFLQKRAREIPTVDIAAQKENLDVPPVLPDNYGIGRMGATHFLERGYEHLAYVDCYGTLSESDRKAGFKAEVLAAGKQFHELNVSLNQAGLDADQNLLWQSVVQLPRPLAVMPLSDPLAVTIMQYCIKTGLKIPDDIAVLGVDNDELICEFAPVPLSSVDDNIETVGYEAAALLDKLMKGEPAPAEPIRIPPKGIILRQSTDTLAIPHPALVRAVRFIRDHYCDSIQTGDVVHASGISRRGLHNAFELHLKRTVIDEITRLRVDHAAKLLRETRKKTYAVAVESGFANYVRLHRVFTRHFGMSPTAYRKSVAAPMIKVGTGTGI